MMNSKLVGIALCFSVLMASCAGESNKKDSQSEPPVSTKNVTAKEIAKAYSDNEVAADNAWKGKTVNLTGTVYDIGKDFTDDAYVIIEGNTEELCNIHCMFTDKTVVATLKKGQTVTVNGVIDGKIVGDVVMNNAMVK
jgi:hypothetical protein